MAVADSQVSRAQPDNVEKGCPPVKPGVLVLCLGNEFRADDGVGLLIADELEKRGLPEFCHLEKSALSGLYLLDELDGYDSVIVVDAIASGRTKPGTVRSFPVAMLPMQASASAHGIGLPALIHGAARWGAEIPGRIHIVAVEAEDMVTLGGDVTADVRAAVAEAADTVLDLLRSDCWGWS